MKYNHPKILVLGATGMLGKTIYKYLSKLHGKNVFGTSREKKSDIYRYFNFKRTSDLAFTMQDQKFDIVINCIGALRGDSDENLILLNRELPNRLEELSKKNNIVIIHISTDAVFSENAGVVYEDSNPNPSDYYGKTKLEGEVKTGINIRTSTLGFDPKEHKGLLENILKNRNKKITGFANQKWSGSTTLQLAEFIGWLTSGNFHKIFKKTNIIHFAPLGPINKYEIIRTFSKMINKPQIIKGVGPKQNRVLKTLYIENLVGERYTDNLEKAFKDLIIYEQGYI